jgi:hypothetical protein
MKAMKLLLLLSVFTTMASADSPHCKWASPEDSAFSLLPDSLEGKRLDSCDSSGKIMFYRGLATCQTETLTYQEIRQCFSPELMSPEASTCLAPTVEDFSAQNTMLDPLMTARPSNQTEDEAELQNMQCRWATEPEVSEEKFCSDRSYTEGTVVCSSPQSPEFSFNTSCLTTVTSMSEMATACAREGLYGWDAAYTQLRAPASDDE